MKSGSVEAYLNFDGLELYIIPYCESPLSSGRISLSLLHSTCVEQVLRLIERSSPLGELHLGRSGVIGLWHCSLREMLCFIADCANYTFFYILPSILVSSIFPTIFHNMCPYKLGNGIKLDFI